MTSNVRLPKDICDAMLHFKSLRKISEDYQRKIHNIHETILDEQEQHNTNIQQQFGDNEPQDPNDHSQQFPLSEQDYNTMKKMYKDAIKHAEHEENVLVVLLAKLQDTIEKFDDKKLVGKSTAKQTSTTTTTNNQGTEARKAKKQKRTHPSTPTTSDLVTTSDVQTEAEPIAPLNETILENKQPAVKQSKTPQSVATTTTTTPNTRDKTASKNQSTRAYLNLETTDAASTALKAGDKVAARVSGAADSDESFWILASVVRPLEGGRYEIEDEDAGDDNDPAPMKKHYKLARNKIAPLPKDFSAHKVISKGTQVLAMFPDTTTFYPAIVEKAPTNASQYFYSLRFENDEEDGKTPLRKVKFSFVVPYPSK